MPFVHVVDEDPSARRPVLSLLESAGFAVRGYADPEHFLMQAQSAQGCVLLELRMQGIDGLTIQAELGRRGIRLPVMFGTEEGSTAEAVQAIRAGAVDFLEKPYREWELLGAVREALKRWEEESAPGAERAAATKLRRLSRREAEVFPLLVRGMSNAVAAAELGISARTVEMHRKNLMRSLECGSILDLVRLAAAARVPIAGIVPADGSARRPRRAAANDQAVNDDEEPPGRL